MSDHHAADRDRPVRTPHEIREHINADHPCCIGVGDACALLEQNERRRVELIEEARKTGKLSEENDQLRAERDKERYIREQVEQRCDPAGEMREVILTRDKNKSLAAALVEAKEEIERLKTSELQSAICSNEAQNCAHKLRDGNRDQQARIEATLALLATRHTYNPECNFCRELLAERSSIIKALRGKK